MVVQVRVHVRSVSRIVCSEQFTSFAMDPVGSTSFLSSLSSAWMTVSYSDVWHQFRQRYCRRRTFNGFLTLTV